MATKYNPKMPSEKFDPMDYAALRNSIIPGALMATDRELMRFDSAEDVSVFYSRELDHIKAQTYDVIYPEFTALQLFPQSS